jgi:DNA-binding MarR family transcriptional regulator
MSERIITNQKRDFKGIFIDKSLWLNPELSLQEICILREIMSLSTLKEGCFAGNQYFADFLGVSKTRISNLITELERRGFLTRKLKFAQGSKRVETRYLLATSKVTAYEIPEDVITGQRIISSTTRKFEGVWIPKKFWLDNNLKLNELLFLVEIDSLSTQNLGCTLSLNGFSDFFGIDKSGCSRILKSLEKKGYITVQKQYAKDNNKQILNTISTPVAKNDEGVANMNHPIAKNEQGIADTKTGVAKTSKNINTITKTPINTFEEEVATHNPHQTILTIIKKYPIAKNLAKPLYQKLAAEELSKMISVIPELHEQLNKIKMDPFVQFYGIDLAIEHIWNLQLEKNKQVKNRDSYTQYFLNGIFKTLELEVLS